MNETHNIQLIVETVLKNPGTLKTLKGDLDKMDNAAQKSASGGWKELTTTLTKAGIAIGAVTIAGKKVYSWAREGADIQYVESRFSKLAVSVGTTADALMRELIPAARGTYSELELMSMAGELMALGLARSHDEAVRLTSVAVKLGMNMNQLVLTLTNQTIRRFDSLGLSVANFKDRLAELKAMGMDDQDAFTMAFLEQAEAQVELVGEKADQTIGTYMALEAAWTDWWSTMKKDMAEGGQVIAKFFTEMLRSMNEGRAAMDELAATVEEGLLSQEFADKIQYGIVNAQRFGEAYTGIKDWELVAFFDAVRFAQERMGIDMSDVTFETEEQVRQFTAWIQRSQMYVVAAEEAAEATDEMADAAEMAKQNFAGMLNALDPSAVDIFKKNLEKIKFEEAGGGLVAGIAGMLTDPVTGKLRELPLNALQYKNLMEESYAATQAVAVAAGEITLYKARKNVHEMTKDWERVDELIPSVAEAMEGAEINQAALDAVLNYGHGWEEALRVAQELSGTVTTLDGRTIDIFINQWVTTYGTLVAGLGQPNLYDPTGQQVKTPNNKSGPAQEAAKKFTQLAAGGELPMQGLAMVGEEGYEYVYNGVVIPHKVSKWLMRAGLLPSKKFATGGTLPMIDGEWGSNLSAQSTSSYIAGGSVSTSTSKKTKTPVQSDAVVQAVQQQQEEAAVRSEKSAANVGAQMAASVELSSQKQEKTLKDIYSQLRKQATKDEMASNMRVAVQEALNT